MLQHRHIRHPVIFGDADMVSKRPQRRGRDPPPPQPADRRHARVVPPAHQPLVHQLHQLALAQHRVSQIQPRKFILVRQRARQREALQQPVVERPVHLELQGADAMGHALEVIAQAMREIIQRVNAPRIPRVVMRRMADAVQHRVPHPDIRRPHVDPRPQRPRAVREFSRPHPRE